jgi:hypothetical protein
MQLICKATTTPTVQQIKHGLFFLPQLTSKQLFSFFIDKVSPKKTLHAKH